MSGKQQAKPARSKKRRAAADCQNIQASLGRMANRPRKDQIQGDRGLTLEEHRIRDRADRDRRLAKDAAAEAADRLAHDLSDDDDYFEDMPADEAYSTSAVDQSMARSRANTKRRRRKAEEEQERDLAPNDNMSDEVGQARSESPPPHHRASPAPHGQSGDEEVGDEDVRPDEEPPDPSDDNSASESSILFLSRPLLLPLSSLSPSRSPSDSCSPGGSCAV
eukprot:m.358193 g.358193  ORF g.358193 m.358193 type:complete len:221 (+) comp28029_c0_seq9:75-737(+)